MFLPALKSTESETAEDFLPLSDRRRALYVPDLARDLAEGLTACGVRRVLESVACPSSDNPDALARAIVCAAAARASQTGKDRNTFSLSRASASPSAWRAILEKLCRAHVPEAVEAGKLLPAIRHWHCSPFQLSV